MASRIHRLAGVALTTVIATFGVAAGDVDATRCFRGGDAVVLNAAFANRVDRLNGADYQRAIPLPDGRTLWTLQDAFVTRPGRSDRLLHNAAVVQQSSCFSLVRTGTVSNPQPWIGAATTDPLHHWYWPLGGTVAADGAIRIFVAEMAERGPRYLTSTEPVGTWLATVDPGSLQVIAFEPAPDPGPSLYGWSVASDDDHTYLYGHCYRQFGYSFIGHDGCTSAITVARVPGRDLTAPLTYWDGAGWSPDSTTAVDIAPKFGPDATPRAINPMQVLHVRGRWLAATKEGDWWGSRIYLDEAPGPTGPWTTVAITEPRPLGLPRSFNTYFANLVIAPDGRLVLGVSNNRWDGRRSPAYRPTFQDLTATPWTWVQDSWVAP
jgi:hypothetical protein